MEADAPLAHVVTKCVMRKTTCVGSARVFVLSVNSCGRLRVFPVFGTRSAFAVELMCFRDWTQLFKLDVEHALVV